MKKKKRIALALAAALMMVLLLAACGDKTIRLGVAGIGGVYQVFGEDYGRPAGPERRSEVGSA